ncbi:MAG TPA: DUF3592 domain-containing protein [Candidatus Binatia bacterium]|jgi:hypothetical protein|nr:DUF3592 domain-containing protein [Candidatus Binatia bacterium]
MPQGTSFFRLARRSVVFWVGALFLFIGSVFLVVGIQETIQEAHYQGEGRVAPAVVVNKSINPAKRRENSSTQYKVTYRFTTAAGQTLEGTDTVSVEEWESLEAGSPTQVTYLPEAPQSNRLAGKSDLGSTVVFIVLGAIFASIGGFLFFRDLRRIRHELRLRHVGIAAEGIVLEVRPSNTKINNVRQWNIYYRYPDHLGQTHEGRSDPLPPDEAWVWQAGDTGIVRFDQQHPQNSVWVGKE